MGVKMKIPGLHINSSSFPFPEGPPLHLPYKCERGQSLSSMEIVLRGILLAAGDFSLDGKSVGLIFRSQMIKL